MRSDFELSTVELDVVWRSAALGELPLVIDVPSPGTTDTERASLERRVWTELVAREYADDHGLAHWRLADLLDVIAHPHQSLRLRVFGRDATRAILARRGSRAVLGVLTNRFRVRSVPDTGLPATLLSLLPDTPPGPGYSVSISTTAFVEAARSARPLNVLCRHGLSADDARTLLTMTTGAVRTGQLTSERRDAYGKVIRSPMVSIHDTPAGRYRSIRTITKAQDHLTVTPATTVHLTATLGQPAG